MNFLFSKNGSRYLENNQQNSTEDTTYLFKFIISNSHSSSSHDGSSSRRDISISCTSRGVARANNPALTC